MVGIDVEGEIGEGEDDEEGGEEDYALEPAAIGKALRECFKSGGGAGGEQEPQEGEIPWGRDDSENVADATESGSFDQLVGRESVGLRGGLGAGLIC